MNTDWSQFVPSMIATFAGFILALIGQWGAEKLHDFFQLRNLKSRIKQELEIVKSQLIKFKETDLDVHPLKTPTWDEAISAGQISILPADLRAKLFNVYSSIQEFNSWSRVQVNYFFKERSYDNLLVKALNELKEKFLLDEGNISIIAAISAVSRRR